MRGLRTALTAFAAALCVAGDANAETIEPGGTVTIEQETARNRNVTLRLRAGQIAIVTVDGGNATTDKSITVVNGREGVVSATNDSGTGALPRQGPLRVVTAASRNTSFRLAVYTTARVATVSAALVTSTADITPTPIEMGGAVRGDLTWTDAWTPQPHSTPGDVYVFQGEAGQQVHLVAHGIGFEPILVLTGPNFSAQSQPDSNGDAPSDNRPHASARLRATLPATGEYRLLVTKARGLAEGTYAIRLTREDMPAEQRETAHADYLQAIAVNYQAVDAASLAQFERIPDLMREGERALNRGDNSGAARFYREVNRIDRENVPSRINEAIASARIGVYGADWTLEGLLRDHPNDAWTPVIRSNLDYVRAVYAQHRAANAAERQAYRDSWTGAVIGGFTAGYNAGQAMEAERLRQQAVQAQAQAAAAAQAQAAAQARAQAQQAQQQQANAQAPAQQPSSNSGQDPTPCVRFRTGTGTDGHRWQSFSNHCNFVVAYTVFEGGRQVSSGLLTVYPNAAAADQHPVNANANATVRLSAYR